MAFGEGLAVADASGAEEVDAGAELTEADELADGAEADTAGDVDAVGTGRKLGVEVSRMGGGGIGTAGSSARRDHAPTRQPMATSDGRHWEE